MFFVPLLSAALRRLVICVVRLVVQRWVGGSAEVYAAWLCDRWLSRKKRTV